MQYNLNDIDENGMLRPGLGMWLIALFFSRQIFYFPLVEFISIRARGPRFDFSFIRIDSSWELLSCIPTFLVLIALATRKPGSITQGLWQRSRSLLLIGGAAQTMILVFKIVQFRSDSFVDAILAVLSVYFIVVTLGSKRLSQVIAEYPKH